MTLKFPFSRFKISDHSMEPAYLEGERVVTFNWGKLQIGDVVVFTNNNPKSIFKEKTIFLIKRIDKIEGRMIFVSGDNKKMTSKVGPIKQDQIIGKVIWKY